MVLPFGIFIPHANIDISQTFESVRHTLTWYHFMSLSSILVLFPQTLSRQM